MNSPGKKASWKRILKITGIAIGALLLIAVLAIHILIVLHSKEPGDSEARENVSAVPVQLSELPSPPADWESIKFGNVSMKLPLKDLQSFVRTKDLPIISWSFSKLNLAVYYDLKKYGFIKSEDKFQILKPDVSFDFWVKAAQTTPDDIAFFQWPWENLYNMASLVWKAGASDIVIFRHGIKGLLYQWRPKKFRGFHCDVFSMSEHIHIKLYGGLKGDAKKELLLRILGGIEISEKAFNKSDYIADVKKLEEKYGKKREKEEEKTDSVLFSIRQKNSTISIKKTADGPRYTVTRHDGGVIMENAAKEEFKARFPQEYNDVFDPLGSIDL